MWVQWRHLKCPIFKPPSCSSDLLLLDFSHLRNTHPITQLWRQHRFFPFPHSHTNNCHPLILLPYYLSNLSPSCLPRVLLCLHMASGYAFSPHFHSSVLDSWAFHLCSLTPLWNFGFGHLGLFSLTIQDMRPWSWCTVQKHSSPTLTTILHKGDRNRTLSLGWGHFPTNRNSIINNYYSLLDLLVPLLASTLCSELLGNTWVPILISRSSIGPLLLCAFSFGYWSCFIATSHV